MPIWKPCEAIGDLPEPTLLSTLSTVLTVKSYPADSVPSCLKSYDDRRFEQLRQGNAEGDAILRGLAEQLCAQAETALTRGPYSVIDKTTLPPSANPHDYWSVAPYWWPNPDTPDGLPYVRKDGFRIPDTELYEPGSERYDRTSLQRLFDDTTLLALAWRFSGDKRYAEHGSRLIRRWFIDPQSRMNPHLRYAQVQRGRNNEEGVPQGIIEMKDLYFFLDAVRLLERSGSLTENDRTLFVDWLREYLNWLLTSPQGVHTFAFPNNQGTFYDLQIASITSYLGDVDVLTSTMRSASERLMAQIETDGQQPLELICVNSQHYCAFNLQGWASLRRNSPADPEQIYGAKATPVVLGSSAPWNGFLHHTLAKTGPFGRAIVSIEHASFLSIASTVTATGIFLDSHTLPSNSDVARS